MMLRQSKKAKILWMKRAIQTCFLLAFSIWVVNQLKLFLVNENDKTDLTSEFFMDIRKSMPNEPLKLTRKTLRIDTEVAGPRKERDEIKARSEESRDREEAEQRNEERAEELMEDFERQIFDKFDTLNDTSIGVNRAEDPDDGWESSLVESFESTDSSVSAFEHDEKEDNLDVEVLEEKTHRDDVDQEGQ